MQTYEIVVRERSIVPNSRDMTLVRTSIGIDQVHVLFDNDEWLDFPVTITFAQNDDMVTQSLVVSSLPESDDYVAEASVTIPHEVIDMIGPIRVTLQGTDANGRHIITAKGSPLSVEESGDVAIGDMPEDVPTIDQWNQAYANAVAETNRVASIANEFEDGLEACADEVYERVIESIGDSVKFELSPATDSSLGGVIVGDGLSVTEDGTLSANIGTATNERAGTVKPDGSSITIDADGTIHAIPEYVLPRATATTLGGIKVGVGLTSSDDGVVRVRTFTEEEIVNLTPMDLSIIDADRTYF